MFDWFLFQQPACERTSTVTSVLLYNNGSITGGALCVTVTKEFEVSCLVPWGINAR